jgi:Domain of unknown function (DUF4260)
MNGETSGSVRLILRIEGLVAFGVGVLAYARFGASWTTFLLFFMTPDLSWLAYLSGPKLGAASYNAAHSYIGALACVVLGVLQGWPGVLATGLIWVAHIGLDRALGYGLKYSTGFTDTHLGNIGRARLMSS